MKTFEEIYNIVEESSHESAFNREECVALYDYLLKLSGNARIVEIGVQYGRSSSLIAEVSKDKGFHFTAVDNWLEDVSTEARKNFESQISKYKWNVVKLWMDSSLAFRLYDNKIDLIHIDGDHEYEGVLADINNWLPKVRRGGFALFDDYGHDSLPGVYKACDEFFGKTNYWKFVERRGNKLGVFQKL